MPARPAPIDAFLCERCGYGLDGLGEDHAAACPECGRPTADSDPIHRPGTAWQRRPGPTAFAVALARSLTRPARQLDRLDPAAGPRGLIAAHAIVCASIALAFALVLHTPEILGVRTRSWATWPDGPRLGPALQVALGPPLVAAVVVGLSLMEALGLRILAWQRGWRFGKRLSLAVVAHGGGGWVVATFFACGGLTLMIESW